MPNCGMSALAGKIGGESKAPAPALTGRGYGRTGLEFDVADVIWRVHPVFYNYEISSDGRVRSVPHQLIDSLGRRRSFPGTELKSASSRGYRSVGISHEGVVQSVPVHTLVCETFHGPRPSPDHQVRHLDGTRANNRVENLAWGTRVENAQDALRHGVNNNARKTHCPKGHEYTRENISFNGRGGRRCRVCMNRQMRESKRLRLQEMSADPNHPLHGTVVGYNQRCRCIPCVSVWRDYLRARRRAAGAAERKFRTDTVTERQLDNQRKANA